MSKMTSIEHWPPQFITPNNAQVGQTTVRYYLPTYNGSSRNVVEAGHADHTAPRVQVDIVSEPGGLAVRLNHGPHINSDDSPAIFVERRPDRWVLIFEQDSFAAVNLYVHRLDSGHVYVTRDIGTSSQVHLNEDPPGLGKTPATGGFCLACGEFREGVPEKGKCADCRHKEKLNLSDRVDRSIEISELVFSQTESLEGPECLGADLAYLLAAISKVEMCEWPETRTIVQFLRKHRPSPTHWVWDYINIVKP